MKIAVIGKSGQLAMELQRYLEVTTYGRNELDLTDSAACIEFVRQLEADAIINAAAYTAVDKAEDDPSAFDVNGDAPTLLATEAARRSIPIVHVSTDYVFNGSGTKPWTPDDATEPVNAYGHSKLMGELGVMRAGGTHAIIRTSWVFSAHGNNFVKTMLRLAQTRTELNVVDDQTGGPTPAAALAEACLVAAKALVREPGKSGIYHFAGSPDVTWADFAREIFHQSGQPIQVARISTAEFNAKAKRPFNSRLDCTSFEAAFALARPDWKAGLGAVLRELGT